MNRKTKTLALFGLGSLVLLGLLYWRFLAPRIAAQGRLSVAQQPKTVHTAIRTINFSHVGEERSLGDLDVTLLQVRTTKTGVGIEKMAVLRLTIPSVGYQDVEWGLIEGEVIFSGPYKFIAEDVKPRPEEGSGEGSAKILIELVVTPTPAKDPIS